jgi:hypothetical protein
MDNISIYKRKREILPGALKAVIMQFIDADSTGKLSERLTVSSGVNSKIL